MRKELIPNFSNGNILYNENDTYAIIISKMLYSDDINIESLRNAKNDGSICSIIEAKIVERFPEIEQINVTHNKTINDKTGGNIINITISFIKNGKEYILEIQR